MSLPIRNGPVSIADQLTSDAVSVNRGDGRWVDRLAQRGYRAVYLGLRLWWFLMRPGHRGAQVALWHDGLLLLVRSSYRRRWDLPGGGVGRGEAPVAAACRELREEIALVLQAEALRPVYDGTIVWEHRRDHVTIFESVLETAPLLRLDNREIVFAAFRHPNEIDSEAVNPHLARYLAQRRAAAHSRN